ncbi:MAG: DUF4384 domain-containing protein [Myxococcales bacterium]|nr:MAG: DUF4384 domain-containing protein [Myxococcales bacterium]
MRWIVCLLMGIVLATGLSSCKSLDQPSPCLGVRETCDSGIQYQGRSYAGNAAYGLLGIQAASGVHAVRQVSDVMQLYLHQCAALCEERERGTLSPEDYLARREALSEKFARFASFATEVPPAEVRESDVALYGETLAAFDPAATATPLRASLRVVLPDGRTLPDGGMMKSGDSFRIEVELSRAAFLYLVIKDSSGGMYKLYPSQAAGGGNPAVGKVIVPSDGMITLDDVPGTETIYLFAGERSPTLESGLEEIGTAPRSPKAQTLLASAVRFRGMFINKKQNAQSGGLSVEALGQATVVFTIEHR